MNHTEDPHAVPFTITEETPAVHLSPTADLIRLHLAECDIAIYMHDPLDGTPPRLIIDIDNELEEDDDPLPLVIYRNDAPIYDEKSMYQQQEGTTTP